MQVIFQPVSELLPPIPPVTTPAELMHGCIEFFSTWIARIGGIVALIGMIKFALSIKSEDTRESLTALLTAVSGFIIMEYVGTAFHFTNAPADTEFQALMMFCMKWIRRVGSMTMLLGAVIFGMSFKENSAVNKIIGMRTIAAGGIVIATSALWRMFF